MPLIGNTTRLVRKMDHASSKLKKVYWRSSADQDKPRMMKHGRSLLNFGLKGVEPDPRPLSSVSTPTVSEPDKKVSEPFKHSVWKNGKYYSNKYDIDD